MNERETTLELAAGTEQVVRLPGLGSAGYLWQYHLEGDEGVAEVEIRRSQAPSLPPPGEPPPNNYSLDELVRLRGVSAGKVRIVCTQVRVGQEAATLACRIINVIVRSASHP
jgi:hypothetical protein